MVCLLVNTGGITWRWKWIKLNSALDPGYKLKLLVLHRYFAGYEEALLFHRIRYGWKFQLSFGKLSIMERVCEYKQWHKIILICTCINTLWSFWMWRIRVCKYVYQKSIRGIFSLQALRPPIPLNSKGSSVYLPKVATCLELSRPLKLLISFLLYRSLEHLVIVVNLWPVSFLIRKRSTGSVPFTPLSPLWTLLVEDLRVWRVKLRWDLQQKNCFAFHRVCFNLWLFHIVVKWST